MEIFLNASPLDNQLEQVNWFLILQSNSAITLERFTHDHAHALTNIGNSPYYYLEMHMCCQLNSVAVCHL